MNGYNLGNAFSEGIHTLLIGGLIAVAGFIGWAVLCLAVLAIVRLLFGVDAATSVGGWIFWAGALVILPFATGLGAQSATRR